MFFLLWTIFLVSFAYSFISSFSYWFIRIFYVSSLRPTFHFLARRFHLLLWLQHFFLYACYSHVQVFSPRLSFKRHTRESDCILNIFPWMSHRLRGSAGPKLSSSSSHWILLFCFVSQEDHLQRLRCLSPKLKCVFWHCLSPMLCYQSISFAISLSIRILIHKYPLNPCLCLHPQCHCFIQWSQETIIPTALLTGLLASRPASLNAGSALESRDIFPWHSMRSGNFLVKQFSWLPFLTRAQTHRSPEMPHQAPLHLCRCSVAHSCPTLWLHGLQQSSLSFTISRSLLRFTSIEFTSYSLSIAKFSACSVLSCIQIEWKLCYLQKLIQDIV